MKSVFRTKSEGLVMVGRYWTRLYVKSKPWAEIQDESCLRPGCHDRRLLEGKVEFGKVAFDHKAHLLAIKERFDHAPVFDNGYRCDKCHSRIVSGDGEVPKDNCSKCHFEQDRLEKYGDTDIMHLNH